MQLPLSPFRKPLYEMLDSLTCLGLHVLSLLFVMRMWQDTYFRNVRLSLPFRVQEDLMHFSAVQICLVSLSFIRLSHTKLVSVSRVAHSPPPLLFCQRQLLRCKQTGAAALDSIRANSRCLPRKWEGSPRPSECVCDGYPLVIILLQ